jgi:peptide subunit release factor 1 (eRF1)
VKTSAEKVERLLAQYRTWGLAVVGPEETLEAMLAPEIPDAEGGTKSLEPRQASLPDLLVTKAKQTGAEVTFIEDAALLEAVGGVGAFLRWRA